MFEDENDELISIKEAKKDLIRAIDLDEWKHSWHLPRDHKGCTDWNDIKTIVEIKSIVQEKLYNADARLSFLGKLLYTVDWEEPVRELEEELSIIEKDILEGNISGNETEEDLRNERVNIKNKLMEAASLKDESSREGGEDA
jgi:hypothetical protein